MTGQGTETKRLPKAIRDELPDELRAKSRIYAKDLPAELQDAVWSMFRDGLAPLAERGQLGSILLQYPQLGLPVVGEPGDDRGGGRAARRHGRARSSSATARGSTRRTPSGRLRFLADRADRVRHGRRAAGLQEQRPAGDRGDLDGPGDRPLPRPERRRPGRRRGSPRRSGSATSTPRDELGEWVPRIREAAGEARETHVLMNNCYANYGTTNAREIAHLLEDLDVGG